MNQISLCQSIVRQGAYDCVIVLDYMEFRKQTLKFIVVLTIN